ncbi:Long-chain-fatty-acid--CoA ligase [Thalassovita gelatinovora]|uniref:Long-chain-fatty-acid--CoA ligase n=1 Tax=Thalassovita gelatinovora TaxID=53501 RepID=A0A0N7LV60_THAGE|nr:long-chain-fatty-acid--CoA ligase [Thalassovita gelatinovora]QIZ80752.1 AMP-binding protein [Thalassovita gelatinovora]CUH65394.1 Long-chain-fatty-acid--CoA ligase [Thalassovita gelatinovora]SEQ90433.1 fatty-acyl-CoA synthase [Thalassovita gelatinovora]
MFDRHFSHWPEGVSHTLALPNHTIVQALADQVAQRGSAPALTYHGHTLSYAEMWDQIEKLAAYLQQRCGVQKGDRVLLYMQNAPQYVIGFYAILRADAVAIPVNPMSRHAELQHYAHDSGATVMLTGQELLGFATPLLEEDALNAIIATHYGELADPQDDIPLPAPLDQLDPADIQGPGITRWTDAIAAGLTPAEAHATLDDLSVIPYSSGTTGQPKGCVHTHRSLYVVAHGGVVWNPMHNTDISLSVLPFFHVTGMQAAMNAPLITGGHMVIMTRWNRASAAKLIERYRVTRWRSIATMAIDLVNDPDFESYDLSSLQMIGGGGAAMPEAIAKKLKDMTGLDYIEGYGMSETIGATHINPVQAPKRQCLGLPIFDVDCRVLAVGDDHELGPNETGEIVMAAPQVFQGYWRNETATKEAFVDHDGTTFLRTGDLGYYDEDGYFFMVDRVKRMINAAGFKVWPAEVEMLMLKCAGIVEACVIGTTDPRRGETVKAFVVPSKSVPMTAEEIIGWCKGEMSAYKIPREIVFVDSLPKSGSNKILWRQLQDEEREKQRREEKAAG